MRRVLPTGFTLRGRREARSEHVESNWAWAARKQAVLDNPTGRILWETMAKHRLSLNSRSPIYDWQVERAYVKAVEDMLIALGEKDRD